jgi:hypothetical protein
MTKEFQIRMAKIEDRKHIMGFIKSYWSDSHILAHDQILFDFQQLIKILLWRYGKLYLIFLIPF